MSDRLLRLICSADVAGGTDRAKPAVAARLLDEHPKLSDNDPYLACATGKLDKLRQTVNDDPTWINRSGGPLQLPPLVAVTPSSLVGLPAYRRDLLASARLLLQLGADPDSSIGSRSPPANVDRPSDAYRLSALYGAAGQNHDLELTSLLLQAGANPNDGESLCHSLEHPECTRLLPELAEQGSRQAVMLMVKLGWPIHTTGGDWDGSALNNFHRKHNHEHWRTDFPPSRGA